MNKIIISSILILCSCDHFEQDRDEVAVYIEHDAKDVQNNTTKKVVRIADNVRDNIKYTAEHMRNWLITPLPGNVRQPIPTRYCYRVLQDILCYRQQMPNWESKLVAYQGTNAPPPAPTTMKLLPMRADDINSLPINRATNAKPIFTTIPEETKESNNSTADSTTATVTIDSTHETLPDSILAPQL